MDTHTSRHGCKPRGAHTNTYFLNVGNNRTKKRNEAGDRANGKDRDVGRKGATWKGREEKTVKRRHGAAADMGCEARFIKLMM